MKTDRTTPPERVRVWDPLLRGFHWLLAALVIANLLLGEFGPTDMSLHFLLGYATLALVIFRIIWGFVGPKPARFSSFVKGPAAIRSYLGHMFERQPSFSPGHNPMGALSVIAILTALLFQVFTGLISDPEDFINVGPLASTVGSDIATGATGWHALGSNIIILLIVLHIGVILFYRIWKNEDLVRPMITGWKWVRGR